MPNCDSAMLAGVENCCRMLLADSDDDAVAYVVSRYTTVTPTPKRRSQ